MSDPAEEAAAAPEAPEVAPAEAEDAIELPADCVDIDFKIEHPLLREWVMWYDNPGGRSAWNMDRFKRIHEFQTVEDFWRMYNNIVAPSRISNGSNYHMFLNGVKPMWEDEANCRGGKWIVIFPKGKKDLIDDYWLSVILSVIGESLEGVDEVSGCVASVRKNQSKIAVWTRDYTNKDEILRIGNHMKDCLTVQADMWKHCRIEYQQHADPNANPKDDAPPPPALYTL